MKELPSGCAPVALGLMVGFVALSFYLFSDRERRPIGPSDACHYAYVWMPKDRITSLVVSKRYRIEELTDRGECRAKEVVPGVWYAKGASNVDALRQEKLEQIDYEAFLIVYRDPSSPAVRNFGDQILPCSFRVDGIDNVSEIAPRTECGEALNFSAFKKSQDI